MRASILVGMYRENPLRMLREEITAAKIGKQRVKWHTIHWTRLVLTMRVTPIGSKRRRHEMILDYKLKRNVYKHTINPSDDYHQPSFPSLLAPVPHHLEPGRYRSGGWIVIHQNKHNCFPIFGAITPSPPASIFFAPMAVIILVTLQYDIMKSQ